MSNKYESALTAVKKGNTWFISGSPDVPQRDAPTGSKYVMLDADGNLIASDPVDIQYPTLRYTYEHSGNKEIHVTAVDNSTGTFTAVAHGLAQNDIVVATVHYPYNIAMPYDHLPKGLKLCVLYNSNVESAQKYYVQVVDADHFQLRLPPAEGETEGALVTFTTNTKMDVTKFHFEQVPTGVELEIADLDCKECLIVVRGKIMNSFRFVRPTNMIPYGTGSGIRTGGVGLDSINSTDNSGSCNLGVIGYNFTYSTLEFKVMEHNQLYQVNNHDYAVYSDAGVSYYKHERQYYHMNLTSDVIEGIKMYGDKAGGFFNGTTVEVYTR